MGNDTSSGRAIGTSHSRRFGRKCVQYILVLFIALTINFALPRLAPGDPLIYFMGQEVNTLTADQRQRMNQELGLDRTLWEQYTDFMVGAVSLELGSSTKFGKPVKDVLMERLPWTLLLVLPAFVLSALIGMACGAYAAWNRGKRRDVALLTSMLALESLPGFWLGMLLIAVFAVNLGWLPSYGAVPLVHNGGADYVIEVIRRLILPVTTITLATVGANFLLTRSSMLDTLGQDYMFMAEAKGVGRRNLIYRHALRNALLPVYTHVTLGLGTLVSGAVVVETVFSYPGIGRLLYESVIARDFPMMQGVFLLITVGVIAANLLADLTYPFIDPRARYFKPGEGTA
ncbi:MULTISPECIES: ABC transporter permease [Paenibacillus]|uniref:Binding-protein-dependent transport system inner membrane protein n=1 Tax=Paenibacillus naphthalenovorans TaxID=162209 RepID=A0A0U2N1V2_9BACL|nr:MULTISPECIES: ABC transporter permease [Paenibacillus]ALS24975.1 binding-protein-dependent transport system inner membrane protein [Paenibacillus naphthalenovorans]